MSFKTTLFSGITALSFALPAMAQAQMTIEDAYARSSGPTARAGAAFMMITNHGDTEDRVISATSDAAARVELHTHIEDENGVMRMRQIEGGIVVPAGEMHMLQRGGDHVMFMGLTGTWAQGDDLTVTFEFEHAEPLTITIPVDLERSAMGHQMGQMVGNGQMQDGDDPAMGTVSD